MPSAFARFSVSAVDGAVVSKPIGEEDDLAVGVLACAIRSASSGE